MRRRPLTRAALVAAVSVGALLGATALPATAAPGGSGPYPADYATASNLPNHTVYRPSTLPAQRMPIVAWSNGACSADGTSAVNFLQGDRVARVPGHLQRQPGRQRQLDVGLADAVDRLGGRGELPVGQRALQPARHQQDRRGRLLLRRGRGVRRLGRPARDHDRHLQQRPAQRRRRLPAAPARPPDRLRHRRPQRHRLPERDRRLGQAPRRSARVHGQPQRRPRRHLPPDQRRRVRPRRPSSGSGGSSRATPTAGRTFVGPGCGLCGSAGGRCSRRT